MRQRIIEKYVSILWITINGSPRERDRKRVRGRGPMTRVGRHTHTHVKHVACATQFVTIRRTKMESATSHGPRKHKRIWPNKNRGMGIQVGSSAAFGFFLIFLFFPTFLWLTVFPVDCLQPSRKS